MYRDLSINRKLIVSHAFIAVAVLVLGSAWYIRYDVEVSRQALVTETSSAAAIIGYNCVSSLTFLDEVAATETLAALQEQEHVSNGAVYDAGGVVFARYSRPGSASYLLPPVDEESHRFGEEHLHLFRRIYRGDEELGTVYLRVGLAYLDERTREYVQRALVVLGLGLLVSLALATVGGRTISQPISRMSDAAQQISVSGDYALRVEKRGEDELGVLADGFNEMLGQIQQRDASLREAQDVLERRVAERTEELRQANAELQNSIQAMREARDRAEEANRSKSTFLANMSHEIRTPMNAILGFAEILSSRIRQADLQHYVADIQESGQRLLSLISDILDMSKAESGLLELEPRPMGTTGVFDEMEGIFAQRLAEKSLELRLEIQTGLPSVVVLDEARVRQILVNLIDNAVKFTAEGYVRLGVSGDRSEGRDDRLDLTFCVQDTGKGIAVDQRERIFGAFVQQDGQSINEYGGTGLGLSMSRRLVELMSGTISVDSEEGKGSTFTVVLPDVPIASQEVLAPEVSAASAPGEAPRPDAGATGDAAGVDDETRARLPELHRALESERPRWMNLVETQTINDVDEFAGHLVALGQEYGYGPLCHWAGELQSQAQTFDVVAMPATLAGFAAVVEGVASLVSADQSGAAS